MVCFLPLGSAKSRGRFREFAEPSLLRANRLKGRDAEPRDYRDTVAKSAGPPASLASPPTGQADPWRPIFRFGCRDQCYWVSLAPAERNSES